MNQKDRDMPSIELEDQEWGQVMAIISTAPWRDANPLLMKIGEQLRLQHTVAAAPPPTLGSSPDRNSNSGKEARHE
jgi:hypothetical protein